MSELETFLTGVADAIREKKGTSEAIPAQSFANEIRSIEGGETMELQPLTFTGAVEATYDGKTPVTVEIPTGGAIDWVLEKTITLEEDVNQLDVAIDKPHTSYFIVFEGRVNNADDTLSDGNASVNIKEYRTSGTFFSGTWAFIRKSGSLPSAVQIVKLPHAGIQTISASPFRGSITSTVLNIYNNYVYQWKSFCIFISNTEQLFKAGGTFYFYSK